MQINRMEGITLQKDTAGIFFAHGRLQTTKDYISLINDFIASTRKLAFDQRNHGDRLVDDLHNKTWKEGNINHAFDMWSVQFGTAKDISYLIDVFPAYAGIKISDWGCFGVSLGGHTTLLTMAHEPRIKVGVSIIGCGDYVSLLTSRALNQKEIFPKDDLRHNLFLDLLAKNDPINLTDRLKRRPLLCCNGLLDKLVPISDNENFFTRMKEENSEKFQVFVDADAKHEVSNLMKLKTIEWFLKW
ncbi:hypothetical protein HK099_000570, partial [Clydaea vesicula]